MDSARARTMSNQSKTQLSLEQEATAENTPPERLKELAKISKALELLVASNPNASPDFLAELAKEGDRLVWENLVANPNTPTKVLLELGKHFPEKLLDNAVFSFLLLENPNFLEEMPRETLHSILKCSSVPESFLEWAATRDKSEFKQAIAENPQTPGTILELIAETKSPSWLLRSIAKNPSAPAELLEKLANRKDSFIDKAIAENPKIPDNLVEKLAGNPNASKALCKNMHISASLLKKLAKPENRITRSQMIRDLIANHPNTPPETLEEWVEKVPSLAIALAKNPSTPITALELLAESKDPKVRKAVAENARTPASLLEELAEDDHQNVREAVVNHPHTPDDARRIAKTYRRRGKRF